MSILGLGGGNFSITRLIIGVGLIRALAFRVPICSPGHPLNIFVAVWSCVAILTSFAHASEESNPLIYSMGLVYNAAGGYLYARAYIKDLDGFALFVKCLIIVLLPLGLLLVLENVTGHNSYAVLGSGISEQGFLREGKIRAMGPFAHPILAGTVGASSLLFALTLWRPRPSLGSRSAIHKRGHCALLIFKRSVNDPVRQLCGAGPLALADQNARDQMVRTVRIGMSSYDNEGPGMVSPG